jgi:uncharacterized repeat protein (TIGR01451 family)
VPVFRVHNLSETFWKRAESSSTAEDRDYDTPLLLEYAANISSGIVVADAEADLAVTKTSQPVPAVPGAAITYTIIVENLGPSAVAGATVADTFPGTIDTLTWGCTGSAGTSCTASGSGNINDSVDLAGDGTITYTVVGTLDSAVTADVVNTASVSNPSGVPDPNFGNNSSTDTNTPEPQADLAIDKVSSPSPMVPGEAISYTIVVHNLGPSDAPSASVTDTFPDEITDVTWACVSSGGALCDSGAGVGDIDQTDDLPAGGTITYTVSGLLPAWVTATVVNTAAVTAPVDVIELDPGNNSSTDSNTPEPHADLTIDKISSPAQMVPGMAISYTILVENRGPSDVSAATVSDTFPDEITDVTWACVSSGGSLCDSGAGSGDIEETVELPAGGTVTYTVSAMLSSWVTTTVVNTATASVPIGVTELYELDNTDVDSNNPAPHADLSVSETGPSEIVISGSAITYTIVVSNAGPSDAVGATVSDVMPAQLSAVTWTCVAAGGTSCTATGSDDIADTVDLPAGGLITYTVLGTLTSHRVENVVTVTAPPGVTDPQGNNSATAINESYAIFIPLVLC